MQQKIYTTSFWKIYPPGQEPHLYWLIEERLDGWLVEPIRDNSDLKPQRLFLSSSEWSRKQPGVELAETSHEGWGV